MKKVFSFNSQLDIVTGVQKVLLDIHHAIRNDYEANIVGLKSYSSVNNNLNISENEYVQWKNPFLFYNSIVILHERKFLMLFRILNLVFFQRIKVVYIHHSILYGKRMMSSMPENIVCISDRGKQNLMEYFKVPQEHIYKIHNCVDDVFTEDHPTFHKDLIKILYPARINNGKRQLEIVQKLRGKLNRNIQILFAGIGPLYEELWQEVKNDEQFVSLGFVDNIPQLMRECDYVMLFSTHEGLPITLIEATMTGTPIICNDVGGNTEVAFNGENAIVVNKWNELIATLNELPQKDTDTYISMCKKSRKIFEMNFTFARFKKNYLNLLNCITNDMVK